MLEIQNLRKIYKGTTKGIQNLTISLAPGDICAFIGSNGAGKSTALKSIVGIHPFDEGKVRLDGISLVDIPEVFKSKIGYAPDDPNLYDNIKGYEYLNFVGSMYGVSKDVFQKEVQTLATSLDMLDALSHFISTYSHGMKQRLVLIAIFLHRPKLLILDEPFVGLDPNATYFLIQELKQRAEEGCIILYSTHVLEVAEKICTRVVLIDNGEVKINDTMVNVLQNETLGDVFRRVTTHEK